MNDQIESKNSKTREIRETISASSTPPLSVVSSKAPDPRTVHVVLMPKGGVGKTLVAWNLAQYLSDKGRGLVAVDLDPMTHSLAEFRGLGVRTVDLLVGSDMTFNGADVDKLAEDMILEENGRDFVLDNGAAGFTALTRYLVDNGFPALLRGFGGSLVVHAVLAGGSASVQCLGGISMLLEAFPPRDGVRFVIWLNEHPGVFSIEGTLLNDMAFYRDLMTQDRFIGTVMLPRVQGLFLADFEHMQSERLTYGEAIASPKFLLMNKQRLKRLREDIWDQLDALKLAEPS